MAGETEDLKKRLHALVNVYIPRLVDRGDPVQAEAVRRRNTLDELYSYLDEADIASRTSDGSRLGDLQVELEEEARKLERLLQKTNRDNGLRGFLERDIRLYEGVASFIGSDQLRHARNSFLGTEKQQIDNRFRDVVMADSWLEAAVDEASRIREELRNRGEPF